MKRLNIIASIWGVLLLALFVFAPPMADRLWLLYLPIHWGVAVAGAIVLLVAIVRAFRGFRPVAPALVIAIIGLALFFAGGFRLGRLTYFQIRKSHYEQLLSEAQRSGEVSREQGAIDEGPPVRYAFYWERGVVDNWIGVVYDPTGNVMTANRSNTDFEVVMLFGGTLYKCEQLDGDWFLCWFT